MSERGWTASSRLIVPVKQSPFWVLALLSLAGYALLGIWFPLTPHFDRLPLPDILVFTPSLLAGLGYAVLLCTLFGLYGLAYRRVRDGKIPVSFASILVAAALFCLPLLYTLPFNATDSYRYFIRGRITTVYRQSPFSMPPDAFPDDPYLPMAGDWAGDTSPYGPVWELVAAAIALVAGDDLLLALLLFKSLAVITHLMIGFLIWLLLDDASPAERTGRALLWIWNPALLLTFAVDGHNDGLMLFWILWGCWLTRRGRSGLGQTLMVVAPLTKPIGLLPLPFFFLATWRRLPHSRAKARFLLASGLGSLAVAWLAVLPFGSPLDLVQRLAVEATARAGFSFATLIMLAVGRLGLGPSIGYVTRGAAILFSLLALWLLWRTWRGRSPVRAAADILAGYLVQAFNFRIWYAAWPFPWLLLDSKRGKGRCRRLSVGLWFLLTSQLSVLIYGHLWNYLLDRDHLVTHLLGVAFTFGLPLLLASLR